jgi:hypothetical protein
VRKVAALQLAEFPSKESYQLCMGSRNLKIGQGPKKGCRAIIIIIIIISWLFGWLVGWLVEAVCYKSEGGGFNFR